MSSLGQYRSGPLVLEDAGLCTDLYELTMAASYLREGMTAPATFSLFVRKLPSERAFLLAAGLEDTLNYLEGFRFSPRAIGQLRELGRFESNFLEYLATVRFTGSVRAMAEGTPVFADEPLLEVTAPIAEAQLVESLVLNTCHLQTLQASKAIRCVLAAGGRPIAEFGLRRTHGIDAALKAVRAGFLAGVGQTSNVLAGLTYGVPLTGTMAHSYVCAFEHELDAFQAFGRAAPGGTTLLLDTYDTVVAAHKAVQVARELEARGGRLVGVRLDSGDLVALSRAVRRILDAARLRSVRIIASGNLDEHAIARCVAAGAPIDVFGVGTRMTVSADAPYLDMAYKLVHYGDRDVLKISPGKETWTGAKQVYRRHGSDGCPTEDVLALAEEPAPAGAEPLLSTVMEGGRVTRPLPPLTAARAYCAAAVRTLPEAVRRLHGAERYRVVPSAALLERQRALKSKIIVSSQSFQTHLPIVAPETVEEGPVLSVRDCMTRDVVTMDADSSLRDAVEVFTTRHLSGVPVTAGGRLVGVLSASDVIAFEQARPGVPTERPELEQEEWTEPTDWVEGEEPPAAYFSELWSDVGADVLERFAAVGGPEWDQLEEHTVGEAMSPSLCRVAPSASIYAAAEQMVRAGVHRLVVMDGATLVGILTSMDIVRAVSLRRLVAAEPAPHPASHALEDARR